MIIGILLFKMELPEDIIGYLIKFIKPKRFNLLNKFCRDHYFRKHGVSIELDAEYLNTDLYDKYRVKMIDRGLVPDEFLEKILGNISFNNRITYIRCNNFVTNDRYKIIRKAFPNLRKFKCELDACITSDIVDRALEGTVITNVHYISFDGLKRLIDLGYKFCTWYKKAYSWPENIRDNIIDIYISNTCTMDFDIGKFPNLRSLRISRKMTRSNIENIKDHPKIKKIKYSDSSIPPYIVKKNGDLVKLVVSTWETPETIKDLDTYETIKKYYDKISITSDQDTILQYELQSKISKKMCITVHTNNVSSDYIKKLLDVFDVKITIQKYEMNTWLKYAKKCKVGVTQNDIALKLYIGNRKLYIYCDEE